MAPKWSDSVVPGAPFFSSFSRPCHLCSFYVEFGSPWAPFWRSLAHFGLPFAHFGLPFAHFGLPFAHFWFTFGALWLTFGALGSLLAILTLDLLVFGGPYRYSL